MKRLLFSAFTALLLVACGKEQANMTVSGTIKGLKKGTLYFQMAQDTTLVTLDSLVVDGNPDFNFSTYVESPQIFYLYLDKNDGNELNDQLEFFGEPGNIQIETSYDFFASEAKVSGSKSHEALDAYNKISRKFKEKNLMLIKQKLEAAQAGNMEGVDSIQKAIDKNIQRSYLYTLNYVFTNKDSYVAPYLVLAEASGLGIKYLDSIQSVLSPEVANSVYGKALTDFIVEVKKIEATPAAAEGE